MTKNKIDSQSNLVGQKAPSFECLNTQGKLVNNSLFENKWSVLYFYPKDMTPGCTIEANDFQARLTNFSQLECQVIGISKDPCSSHLKFAEKEGLAFELLSDESCQVCESFGVWKEKILYGKKHMGIERTTFLINPQGVVVNQWSKVKVDGHAEQVLETLKKYLNKV